MSKPRILVVDDTPANIKILADLLRRDYLLSVATSGPDALEIAFSGNRPDLVLLDVMMPEMDGYEVCRRLKADLRTQDVPVIFVTAMTEVDDETKGFSLGAVDYITKPVRPPIVQSRVAAHIELALARKTLAAQNKALSESLAVAADVQRSLLPKALPALPGLEVAGRMTPCDAVGGDYLDFLVGDDFAGRGFGVAVGDVMGHGPAAALLMTAARASLRMRASRAGGLGEVVTDMNRHLVADLGDVERFMTFYLIEVRGDAVTWVSAGHEPALLVDPGSGTFTDLEGDGPVLGIDPDISFREHHALFRDPGQVLALCTDGITEAWNAEGEQFGRERFKQSLLRHAHQDAGAILECVIRDVFDFRGLTPQKDDLTLVVLKRTS
ncbi:PP2C family protein-serine/threonine phosphatase [Singulisphaera acidiphila]|uniref:SpoIIE-like protein with response regulator receiver domain n=1 Tax=Singulisphaera acidiphila (strain ATCC BAA-1392 / DSM 18658 / VKM B-2454 / MOB10) TaxID=886293 RepID=L0DEM6_SINAD|nr:SpoIIE family protein phosphatase [Singulisphaera acidiphila]AGA27824.1 SpoIIE-like protein with response regulator receiver domain [Singulisphaera acidiphila DSM 18658]